MTHGPDRIVLTRSHEDCASWAQELERRGAVPIAFPCIDTEIVDAPAVGEQLRAALAAAAWLVFTSRRGVAAFAELAGPLPATVKVATVGPATAAAAAETLGRSDLVGTGGTAAELADELCAHERRPTRMLLVLAENAGTSLEQKLAAAGHHVRRIEVYRTVPKPASTPKRRCSSLGADWIFLASPSSSTGFVNQVELDCNARVVTIGPTTTAAARRDGFSDIYEARTPSLDGMMEAIECRTST